MLESGEARSLEAIGRADWLNSRRNAQITDDEGNPKRMRKGLSTRDEAEADRLVAQMNRILYDERLWHLAAKERAAREFDPRVVSIFYDVLEPAVTDGWSLREEALPLPGREDGFAKVLILGSTGAGKTTLVRQLIGSHPKRDRFPSTSTAKTTVADIEVVVDDGAYSAVVSFFMKDKVRLNIEEWVTAAVGAAAEGAVPVKVAGQLLEHPEQRFRLSYLLGAPNFGGGDDWDDWDDAEPGDVDSKDPEVGDAISRDERAAIEAAVLGYVEKCDALAKKLRGRLGDDVGLVWNDLGPGDRDAFQELLEEHVLADAEAQELIDEIMDEVESKFAILDLGKLERHHGWPVRWTFTTEDRGEFIGAVNRFTSNYADHFGRLLTPRVEGIRVRGPFRPAWFDDDDPLPKLVLLDGEGLGHTSETSASLPTSVTSKYALADTILLVDNAKQPMLAAPSAVIRSVAATGHDSKPGIVFTHFDQVKGDNLRGVAAKRTHVQNSLDNALLGLRHDDAGGGPDPRTHGGLGRFHRQSARVGPGKRGRGDPTGCGRVRPSRGVKPSR